jgi:hypothetical protein
VQKSGIRSVAALSRLWLILALSTLYMTAQGAAVVASGKRRWVDTHWFRGNSYFRIGWEWVKTALNHGWRLIRRVSFRSYRDPDPVMASRQQHQKRLCRLAFKVRTYKYAPGLIFCQSIRVPPSLAQRQFDGLKRWLEVGLLSL